MKNKTSMMSVALTALVLGATLGTTAMAAGAGSSSAKAHFQQADADASGAIERSEFKGSDEMFATLDKNGDGRLTGDELREGGRKRAGADGKRGHKGGFEKIDANGDGSITIDEARAAFPERAERFIAAADADKDGTVSKEEAAKLKDAHGGKKRAEQGKPRGDRSHPDFTRIDANGDGNITASEAEAALGEKASRFMEKLDADKDGTVTRAEIKAAKERHAHSKAAKQSPKEAPEAE